MRKIFLSVCGLGFLPGSGTITSAVALWLLYRFNQSLPISWIFSLIVWLAIMAALYFLAQLFINQVVADDDYDQSWIVVDEWLGMMVAYLPILLWHSRVLWHLLTALVVFRLLDIIKPGFIGRLDRRQTASAVLWDDVAAGLVTAAVLAVVMVFWPPLA